MRVQKLTMPNKSNFIRQQPATMSAADIIAVGKKAGLKISSSLVYMVRGRASASGKATEKSAAKRTFTASLAPATPAWAKPAQSKAECVRSRSHLSPKEIVEDAKGAGIKLDVG